MESDKLRCLKKPLVSSGFWLVGMYRDMYKYIHPKSSTN